jgi:hypothetical protein
VIAHPGRYELANDKLAELLGQFRDLGGTGIEVVAPNHRPDQMATLARLCRAFGLKASAGSDYHGPREQRLDLGKLPPIPNGLAPIWDGWAVAESGNALC